MNRSSAHQNDDASDNAHRVIVRSEVFEDDGGTEVESDPERTPLPEGYRMDERGLYEVREVNDRNIEVRVCGPIRIEARVRDFDGEGHGIKIAFVDSDGAPHEFDLTKSELRFKTAAVIGRLVDAGLDIDPDKGAHKSLIGFLSLVKPAKTIRVARHVGYQADDIFVLPTFTIGTREPVRLDRAALDGSAFAQRGSLESWRDLVAALAVGNPRLILAMSVAFTGPLLRPVSADSIIIHLRGQSSIGKTTAARLAASAWGSPTTDNGFISTWNTTANAIELVAKSRCDTLLPLDEVQMATPENAQTVAYMISHGRGKSRMQADLTASAVSKWKVSVLSTGEVSLPAHLAKSGKKPTAGQIVRFIDVPADAGKGYGLFTDLHGFASADAFSRKVAEAAMGNYGLAGPEFVARLISRALAARGSAQTLPEQIKTMRDDFTNRVAPAGADGQVRRVASTFGLIAVAGHLAADFAIVPWSSREAFEAAETCFKAWLDDRGHAGAHDIEEDIAQIRRFLLLHLKNGFLPWEQGGQSTYGYVRSAPRALAGVYVKPTLMKSDVCKGMDWKLIKPELIRRKILIPNGADACPPQQDPDTREPARFFRIALNFLGDLDSQDAVIDSAVQPLALPSEGPATQPVE